MERIIIYLLALVNLSIGLILFYRKPRPFGRRTFEDYPAETHGAACGWAAAARPRAETKNRSAAARLRAETKNRSAAARLRAETKNRSAAGRSRTETKNKPAEHDGHAGLPY